MCNFHHSSSERRIQEEREREAEAARQLEAKVTEAFEAALVDRADDLRAELERRYQAEIDRRVKQRLDEIERDYQRKLEEEKRMEEEERRKQAELDRILEENNRKLMEARRREDVAFQTPFSVTGWAGPVAGQTPALIDLAIDVIEVVHEKDLEIKIRIDKETRMLSILAKEKKQEVMRNPIVTPADMTVGEEVQRVLAMIVMLRKEREEHE
ncbi:hypothetical protein PHET_07180 [Paragonimus heterotremus]|uniref:Uncharacterized protein n=1 Tax=Paragonimus heterotremus TaxID=100268 RepID=A0A8J4T6M9_9TREM|nr:hypothetical protein PHET_07180 [Paragonimus heterotremus]